MTVGELPLWFFTHFGLAYIVGHSLITVGARRKLFERFPLFVTMLECPACFGFWSGFITSFIAFLLVPFAFEFGTWKGGITLLQNPLALGVSTSGVNYLLARLTNLVPAEYPSQLDVPPNQKDES